MRLRTAVRARSADNGPPVSIEVRAGGSPVVIEVSGGFVRARLGSSSASDLVLSGEPQLILALFSGRVTGTDAASRGLSTSGDANVLDRVLPGAAASS
jgi:hypothetical protein